MPPLDQPGDRGSFLKTTVEAFGKPPDRDLRASLLLGFHKMAKAKPDTFLSKK